jgi:hypothetical protein
MPGSETNPEIVRAMRKTVILIIMIAGMAKELICQEPLGTRLEVKIIGADTLLFAVLPEVIIYAKMPSHIKAEIKRNERLVYNVKKAYPYAKLAGIKFKEYESILLNAGNDETRKQLMKEAEDHLKLEFEDDIRALTFKQGLILIKLVDRETGNSSYAVIQELRGKFAAFFWQTFARLFGYNLKIEYDPAGADSEIEDIVLLIEKGLI